MSLVAAACATLLVAKQPIVSSPVSYRSIERSRRYFHFVIADVTSGALAPKALYRPGLHSVGSLLSSAPEQPLVAVTGTFFGPSSGYPVADILVNGELRAVGQRGSAIGVKPDGRVQIFDTKFRHQTDWTPYTYGLRGAVRLISNGKVNPNPKAQRFRDRRIWGRAARVGVGVRSDGKMVIAATKNQVTLSEFGKAMKSQGVVDAISLDGGSSTCLVYKGKVIIRPSRKLSNMLVVIPQRDAF